MEWVTVQKKALSAVKRYRYVLLVLLIGLGLMLIPSGMTDENSEPAATAASETQMDISTQLAQILSKIQGAGEVEVMLTLASGEKTVYQTDGETDAGENGSIRTETVIITGADRGQSGLIQQVEPPLYRGAIVVCQGADRAQVKLAIVEAVSRVTGLGADQISVLKMK